MYCSSIKFAADFNFSNINDMKILFTTMFFGMAVTASFAEGSPGNVEMILSENFDKIKNSSGGLIDCPYYPRSEYDKLIQKAYEEWLAAGHNPNEEKFPTPEYNPEKDLSDLYRTGRPSIDEKYMQTPGWTGSFLWAGDGAMAIYMPDNGGYLVTPYNLNLQGVVRVSFRARSLQVAYDYYTGEYDETRFDPCHLYIIPAKNGGGSYADSDAPVFEMVTVPGDDEWHEFSVEFETLYDGNDCGIQFNALTGGDDGLLIDDIKIERVKDKTISPRHASTSHFTGDGFRVNYDADSQADRFLINVWERRVSGKPGVTELDLNGVKANADGIITDYNIPEGWSFELNDHAPQVGTNPEDKSNGILFVANEQAYSDSDWLPYMMTSSSATVKKFECDLYCIEGNNTVLDNEGNPKQPQLFLLGYDADGNAEYILDDYLTDEYGNILKEGRGFHLSTDELYDEYYNPLDITDKYSRIALVVRPRGNERILIDNIRLETEAPVEDVLVVDQKESTQRYCDVDGLDMTCEHFFTVQAVKGDYVSAMPATRTRAFGIPAPVALAATDVDARGAFTANWQSVDNAKGYIVELAEKFVAETETPDFVVMSEGFDKTAIGEWLQYNLDNPYDMYPGVAPMDDFTSMSGWKAKGGSLIAGHLGCQRSSDGDMNYLQSPLLSLCYGDKSAKVSVRAVSKTAEQLIIQYSMDEDVEPLMIPFVGGVAEGTVSIPDASNIDLYFYGAIYNASYTPAFYIDEVKVSQTLKTGEVYDQVIQMAEVANPQTISHDFVDLALKNDVHYVYRVRSFTSDSKSGSYVSENSNEIEVPELYTSGVDNRLSDSGLMPVVRVEGRNIIIGGDGGAVYTSAGVKIAEGCECRMPEAGVYIVVTPQGATKIYVK